MSTGKLKTASFTVRATMAQSIAWKRHAEAEGAASVGSWIATSLDRYLDALKRAGKPLPLAFHRASFPVTLGDGVRHTVRGYLSPPFGIYRGTPEAPNRHAWHLYCLVYVPGDRILATLRSFVAAKGLASELSRLWVRWGGNEPAEDPGPVVERFRREDA